MNELYFPYLKPSEAAYGNNSFLWALLLERAQSRRVLCLLGVAGLTLAVTIRSVSWKKLDPTGALRILMYATIATTIWNNSLYSYNFYFGSFHMWDRLIVAGSGLASLAHPAFVPLHAISALVSNYQLDYPFGLSGEWTNRLIAFQILILFHSFLVVFRLAGYWAHKIQSRLGFVLLGSLLMANYFIPGLAKLEIGSHFLDWILENDLGNLVAAAHARGWPLFGSPEGVAFAASSMSVLSVPIQFSVVLVELASAACFFRRRVFVSLAVFRILFHLGIFISSGVFFWNWVVLNLAFLWAGLRYQRLRPGRLFTFAPAALCAVLVIFFSSAFKPHFLGWFDAPLSEFHKFVVVDPTGGERELRSSSFAPYETTLGFSDFGFLNRRRHLVRYYGSTLDLEVYRRLQAVTADGAELEHLRQQRGEIRSSDVLSLKMDEFIRRYHRTYGRRMDWPVRALSWLGPPAHLHTSGPPPPDPRWMSEASAVVIWEYEFLFVDGQLVNTHAEIVRSIGLDD